MRKLLTILVVLFVGTTSHAQTITLGDINHDGFSIFLPATGFYYNSSVLDDGSEGKYWSSTQLFWSVCDANMLYVNSEGTDKSNYYRFSGQCVRPVSQ